MGHADAGFGKIRYKDLYTYLDIKSMARVHDDYVGVEPFIDWQWDMRIQKIG